MKVVNILLAIMFVGFAILQYNDPDPLTWILIYGAMAAVCLLAAYGKYNRLLMAIQSGAYFIYALILWPGVMDWMNSPDRSLLFDDLAKMQFSYIEETREFLGLLICLAVLGFYFYKSKRKG